jgi:N utilization substance protein B
MVRSDRHTARLQALEILYQREITGEGVAGILEERTYSTENGEPDEFCKSLALGVEANLQRIDDTIGTTSEHWTVSRMPMVDRSILRVATYELLYSGETPASVAINEAVELAKTFGGEDSSKFVNGVLGRIAEQYRSGE